MTGIEALAGALGGVVVFLAGVAAMLRGLFRQVTATEANTVATRELSRRMDTLTGEVQSNTQRIARLEDRTPRRRPGPT